jgi:hypothetical protein
MLQMKTIRLKVHVLILFMVAQCTFEANIRDGGKTIHVVFKYLSKSQL